VKQPLWFNQRAGLHQVNVGARRDDVKGVVCAWGWPAHRLGERQHVLHLSKRLRTPGDARAQRQEPDISMLEAERRQLRKTRVHRMSQALDAERSVFFGRGAGGVDRQWRAMLR
jgi:hypothetical protein